MQHVTQLHTLESLEMSRHVKTIFINFPLQVLFVGFTCQCHLLPANFARHLAIAGVVAAPGTKFCKAQKMSAS